MRPNLCRDRGRIAMRLYADFAYAIVATNIEYSMSQKRHRDLFLCGVFASNIQDRILKLTHFFTRRLDENATEQRRSLRWRAIACRGNGSAVALRQSC